MRKYLIYLFLFSFALLIKYGDAHAFAKGTEQDCSKCHTLNAEQARDVLKVLVPEIKILNIQPAPVNGLWELGIEAGGQKNIVYLDFSKKKIILGKVIDIQTKANLTKESFDKINKVDISQVPLDNSLVMGDKDARYKIVVFDDPE
jgi:thiol:disulfide interchange protein DsbC